MLAGDADRERAVDVLKEAYTQGRLRPEEYDERVGRAYQARTYDDLDRITADIPGPMAPYPVYPQVPFAFAPPVQGTNGMATASLVCGILGTVTMGAASIPAIICGHLAKGQIRRTGQAGDGQATAGLVLGYLCLFGLLAFIGTIVAVVASAPGP
ncbi:hypothetical protein RVR_6194 [Actinacidiphila reveromycinica]|uniref:DUF4190 domain-containing protein n=1 Tax=Actinacidiphila reveromycinica TaxID=659352 RepID=A0A7U3VQ95_9ACTN|nr:DUF1707 and DUF4190 domain-containing protein [Streptomyces sp. SN-593]BBA99530.1 hypothetical protein RVR_6194 [Streptomyces sp. SN-593]